MYAFHRVAILQLIKFKVKLYFKHFLSDLRLFYNCLNKLFISFHCDLQYHKCTAFTVVSSEKYIQILKTQRPTTSIKFNKLRFLPWIYISKSGQWRPILGKGTAQFNWPTFWPHLLTKIVMFYQQIATQ